MRAICDYVVVVIVVHHGGDDDVGGGEVEAEITVELFSCEAFSGGFILRVFSDWFHASVAAPFESQRVVMLTKTHKRLVVLAHHVLSHVLVPLFFVSLPELLS